MGLLHAAFSADPRTLKSNVSLINDDLRDASATEVITWALANAARPVISTNFRPGAGALLHLVTRVQPDIPVVWVDTGYNTPATYRYIAQVVEDWQLNLQIYTPRVTAAYREAVHGAIPTPDQPTYQAFVRDAKLEPFERAFNILKPDVWFTGIRAEQSEYRQSLDIVSRGPQNSLRVAPLLEWSAADVEQYLVEHSINNNDDYVDPTKPGEKLECGLQQLQ